MTINTASVPCSILVMTGVQAFMIKPAHILARQDATLRQRNGKFILITFYFVCDTLLCGDICRLYKHDAQKLLIKKGE